MSMTKKTEPTSPSTWTKTQRPPEPTAPPPPPSEPSWVTEEYLFWRGHGLIQVVGFIQVGRGGQDGFSGGEGVVEMV